jgi:thiol-disulfide isomerase/thioredoxin
MKRYFTAISFAIALTILFPFCLLAQKKEVAITIHLNGVYESNITLLSSYGTTIFKPILKAMDIKDGDTTKWIIPEKYLPGQFVLRFDYKEKDTSAPYPSEKYIIIGKQDLELWADPMNINNPGKTWFQQGEKENETLNRFYDENSGRRKNLDLLQNFLMKYDATESLLYKEALKEFEQRRQNYNQWLTALSKQDKELFVSRFYQFQHIPKMDESRTEDDRIKNLIMHYFDGIDFKDSLILRVPDLRKWMDSYVNLYGQLSTTIALRDSLFPLAGKNAIEMAKKGNPLVYGWMVDYFYRGYESYGLDAGMKILEPYIDDPNCLTSKRMEINRRLKGIETLVAGSKAPEISIKDKEGATFTLSSYAPEKDYTLLLFWSAGCSHCIELIDKMYPWYQQTNVNRKLAVVAISLDETAQDIKAWELKKKELQGWKHLHVPDGVRSKVAGDYSVLSTPTMFLLDTKTKDIVATPNTLNDLRKVLK